MNLNQLITRLELEPQEKVITNGFGKAHSYRGYYDQIAFEPKKNVTVGEMLNEAKKANGNVYYGWKGGEYLMNLETVVNIAPYSYCSLDGSDLLIMETLEMMLSNS